MAKDFSSVRKRILLQYASFLQRLGKSVSGEVRVMSRIAAADVQSVTGKNCYNMMNEFNLDPWTQPVRSFAKEYKMYETPAQDTWRSSLLLSLMREKYDMDVTGEDVETISGLIESLCSS